MTNFVSASRRLLALGAVLLASTMASCVGNDEEATPTGSVRQAQAVPVMCQCMMGGSTMMVPCFDTCFGDEPRCGDPSGPCMGVCLFDEATLIQPGTDCQTGNPMSPQNGRCASSGIGMNGDAGCCLSCLDPDTGTCGGPNDDMACGNPGEDCRRCTDDVTWDCLVPDCQQGKCELVPAPVGNDCATDGGDSGRCSVNGVCCVGCLLSGGSCNVNGLDDSGACGRAGATCMGCNDNNACNGVEYCDQGTCRPGQVIPNCDDGNPCTVDDCDPTQGCIYDPNVGAVCSDGDPCTTDDACDSNGECKSGSAVGCNDGNDCTVDSCGGSGTCQNEPKADGVDCTDDTSTCGSAGQCQNGRCVVAGNCHDESNPCLTSDCDNNGGCSEVNKPNGTACDDGDPCTTGDSCQAGQCEGGDEPDCDDANPCTDDSCDPGEGCVHQDSDTECSDGDPCTVDDKCTGGDCVGDPLDCEPTNSCQQSGVCVPDSGACAFTNKKDGTECGDGGECEGGVCTGATTPGTGGDAGETGSGGSAGTGGGAGAPGTDGRGGTFSGDNYVRDPKGCDCREAPGSVPTGGAWLGLLGLSSFVGRRRRFSGS